MEISDNLKKLDWTINDFGLEKDAIIGAKILLGM
jgi:hypothetical protein